MKRPGNGRPHPRVISHHRKFGFELLVVDTGSRGWQFEWRVRPISTTAKALITRNYGPRVTSKYVMLDPTSSDDRTRALVRGHVKINELRSPFWWKRDQFLNAQHINRELEELMHEIMDPTTDVGTRNREDWWSFCQCNQDRLVRIPTFAEFVNREYEWKV